MNMEEILKTQYSEEFDQLSKNRVCTSFFKYGPIEDNFGKKLVNAIKSCNLCINKYQETGNTEYLVDAKNYLMFEFMYPTHKKAHFEATDSKGSAGISGISINEIMAIKSENILESYK
ncbi:MAG: hypothetical protein WA125_16660 [Desulfosporosinus sp.]